MFFIIHHQFPINFSMIFSMEIQGICWIFPPKKSGDDSPQQVPSDCIGYITGSRRATLGRMEEELPGSRWGGAGEFNKNWGMLSWFITPRTILLIIWFMVDR